MQNPDEPIIKYHAPFNTLAVWLCLLRDFEWYTSVDEYEIHWRMSLPYDKEEQNFAAETISIKDDVVPEKIRPVAPVQLFKGWVPDALYRRLGPVGPVKTEIGRMPRLSVIVENGGRGIKIRNVGEWRVISILNKCARKYRMMDSCSSTARWVGHTRARKTSAQKGGGRCTRRGMCSAAGKPETDGMLWLPVTGALTTACTRPRSTGHLCARLVAGGGTSRRVMPGVRQLALMQVNRVKILNARGMRKYVQPIRLQ